MHTDECSKGLVSVLGFLLALVKCIQTNAARRHAHQSSSKHFQTPSDILRVRSLVAVLSGHLLGAYALLFVGALGGAFTSWLAFRSAGKETEKQIKQCIGNELAQALKVRAQEAASSVASTSMQPCLACIDRCVIPRRRYESRSSESSISEPTRSDASHLLLCVP